MSKENKKDELVGRTFAFSLKKKGRSVKFGTVVNTNTKGNETKLILDTDKKSDVKGKEIRDQQKTDFRSLFRTKAYYKYKCSYCFKAVGERDGIFVKDIGCKFYVCRNKVCSNALWERTKYLFQNKDENNDRHQNQRRYSYPQLRSPIFQF